MAYFRRFWVKEPRCSENISGENCYLYRSTRHCSKNENILVKVSNLSRYSSSLEELNRTDAFWRKKDNLYRVVARQGRRRPQSTNDTLRLVLNIYSEKHCPLLIPSTGCNNK